MTARIELERRDATLVVTITDDPGRLPAYDGAALKALGAAWAELDAAPDLRVAVLRSSSPDAFCVGADLGAVMSGGFNDPPYPEVAEPLAAKPIVAAIEGRCLGGGLMIACGADLRIAGAGATFGLPEARWNLPAQWLGALARQLLPAHVLELALLADEVQSADRLHQMGWLNRVVDDGDSFRVAMDWADRLAVLAPGALRRFKELAWLATTSSVGESLVVGHRHAVELMGMADTVEGGRAFAERRRPEYRDE